MNYESLLADIDVIIENAWKDGNPKGSGIFQRMREALETTLEEKEKLANICSDMTDEMTDYMAQTDVQIQKLKDKNAKLKLLLNTSYGGDNTIQYPTMSGKTYVVKQNSLYDDYDQ